MKNINFSVPVRHIHSVEAYGLIFHLNKRIGLIADTRYFKELPDHYSVDILIVNVLRVKPIGEKRSDRPPVAGGLQRDHHPGEAAESRS